MNATDASVSDPQPDTAELLAKVMQPSDDYVSILMQLAEANERMYRASVEAGLPNGLFSDSANA